MKIGFGTGDFYRINTTSSERFSKEFINHFKAGQANAIELACIDESLIDHLIRSDDVDLSAFKYVSIHTPDPDQNIDPKTLLKKLAIIHKKFNIQNVVFHADSPMDWNILKKYPDLPISIENMDITKDFGKTIEEINSILSEYDFKLNLDLQHCFTNDESMNLALEFQKEFKGRIAEYHISGFEEKLFHYPLFKTRQDQIIHSLQNTNIPIIIESTFDEIGEHEKEIAYIKNTIKNH
ncbi:hypothetical protein ACFL2R_01675 [Patescibacteria group bacterium]